MGNSWQLYTCLILVGFISAFVFGISIRSLFTTQPDAFKASSPLFAKKCEARSFSVSAAEYFGDFGGESAMGSFENPNWLLDCPLIDELPVPAGDFYWNSQGFNTPSNVSVEIESSFVDSDGLKETVCRKRRRSESSNGPGSKACREKIRRDRLNDKFLELGSILEPGKQPKMDKAAILSDAARMVTQLRMEAQKLKDSTENLQEKIKELKTEKNELRDEKQKLKAEKENLERQVKLLNARPSFMPSPPVIPAAFAAQGKGAPLAGHKMMMPIIGYPGFPMWQFMPPADVDTSQDAESCPPVA